MCCLAPLPSQAAVGATPATPSDTAVAGRSAGRCTHALPRRVVHGPSAAAGPGYCWTPRGRAGARGVGRASRSCRLGTPSPSLPPPSLTPCLTLTPLPSLPCLPLPPLASLCAPPPLCHALQPHPLPAALHNLRPAREDHGAAADGAGRGAHGGAWRGGSTTQGRGGGDGCWRFVGSYSQPGLLLVRRVCGSLRWSAARRCVAGLVARVSGAARKRAAGRGGTGRGRVLLWTRAGGWWWCAPQLARLPAPAALGQWWQVLLHVARRTLLHVHAQSASPLPPNAEVHVPVPCCLGPTATQEPLVLESRLRERRREAGEGDEAQAVRGTLNMRGIKRRRGVGVRCGCGTMPARATLVAGCARRPPLPCFSLALPPERLP